MAGEFLQDLPCNHPESFTEKNSSSPVKQDRILIAHDVPIEDNEKVIKPEKIPYFIKILHKSVLRNTGEEPQLMSTPSKKRRHDSDDDCPSSSSRKS